MGLIIVTLITFNINYYSFAIEPGNNVIRRNTVNFTTGTYDGTESDGSASYGAILEKEKIMSISKCYLNTFINITASNIDKNQVKLSNNFVNLYDVEGNLFAYMIPILYANNQIGYITIGAAENNCSVYEITFNDNAEKIEAFINGKKARVIFIPPMRYVIKSNDGKYFELEGRNGNTTDITQEFKESQKRLMKIYSRVVKAKEKSQIAINTMNSTNTSTNALSVIENAKLINSSISNFVPVYEGTTIYYGGDQAWYDTETKKNRGCGPVAAANITCYFARKPGTTWDALYSPRNLSKTSFISHMDTLYSYINPGLLGTWWGKFVESVEKFSSDRGAPLRRVVNNWDFTLTNTSTYIKNGLNNDSPVAMLNMQPFGDYEYKAHWMTITEYYRYSDGTRWVTVSTWGERRSISYDVWFESTSTWGGGLIYFE